MSTTSASGKKKSYFSPVVLAAEFMKAFEKAGWTPQQMDTAKRDLGLLREFLKIYKRRYESCLKIYKEIQLPGHLSTFDPHKYYQNSDDLLCVGSSFTKNILSVAKKIDKIPARKSTIYTLRKSAYTNEIVAELPENYIWEDASEFCFYLAYMMDLPLKVRKTPLYISGYSNIFYVRGEENKVFAVSVCWDFTNKKWDIDVDSFDDELWLEGFPIFSYN